MKITAERKSLADAIGWVSRAVPKNVHVAALGGIRLHAEGDYLTLSAFDYDVFHEARIRVEVVTEGEALVSGPFLGIIGALTGKDVTLEVGADPRLTITSGRSVYRGQLLDLRDYPALPAAPPAVGSVPADELADAVTACLGPADDAAPTEAVRGLRLEVDDEGLHLVGMETRFMVHRALDWSGDDLAATLPGKAVNAAVSGLAGAVTIGAAEAQVSFSDTERTVVIRTLSGKYAEWRRVPRPAEQDRFSVIVERDDLIESIKRGTIVTRSLKDASSVLLTIEPDSIEVTATNDTAGGSDVLDAEGDGSESIPFSPILLGQALAAMPSGPVRLGIGKRRSPDMAAFTTIRPAGGDIDCEAVLAARKGGTA